MGGAARVGDGVGVGGDVSGFGVGDSVGGGGSAVLAAGDGSGGGVLFSLLIFYSTFFLSP